ncbi:VOC family protein [Paracoccus sanguinis]|uniref:VOC family protein n=1 Tax=Paracoccus sanguinis TaxID=1545044 RepID=UPI00145122AF|nr:VOC family protein [Paracoccus sanguinis]QJD17986.1 VOC family protein [Paracoccus sanguinis]
MADFHSLVIDHLNIGVLDLDRALPIYEAALRPLGLAVFFRPEAAAAESRTRMIGFGRTPDRPVFWLVDAQPPGPATHIAFAAADRAQVDAFHAAALAAGATDNGPPGLRWYHPHYYGAFIRDPDGQNIEAVCHAPA